MKREYPHHPLVGVGALVKEGDSVLLIKRRYDPEKGFWSIPGGVLELGETVREAAQREVLEETGLRVELEELIDVIDLVEYDAAKKIRFHYVLVDFLARPIGGEIQPSREATAIRWVRSKELPLLNLTRTAKKLLKKIRILEPAVASEGRIEEK